MAKKKEESLDLTERNIGVPATQSQRGFEQGVDPDDLIIPRARVIQPTSEDSEEFKTGTIINSLTKEVLPEQFIPIVFSKNWIRFNPRNSSDPNYDQNFEPGDIIWRSNDPLDPRVQSEGKWGPNDEPPKATAFLNFLSYFPGVAMPVVVSFSKTSYKAGKVLLSTARHCSPDLFSMKYSLSSSIVTNDKGKFAVLKVASIGPVEGEELAFCEKMWKDFSAKMQNIKVHDIEKTEEETGEDIPF